MHTQFVATHVVAHQRESFSLRSAAAPGSALRLQNRPLAALLPGGGVAEEVFTTSINRHAAGLLRGRAPLQPRRSGCACRCSRSVPFFSFLNIYNTILVARLVLTW
jgi:hypothetical protein